MRSAPRLKRAKMKSSPSFRASYTATPLSMFSRMASSRARATVRSRSARWRCSTSATRSSLVATSSSFMAASSSFMDESSWFRASNWRAVSRSPVTSRATA